MSVKPVTDWENQKVEGRALSSQAHYEDELAEIEKIRARQAAYLASLPTDPKECLPAALKILHPGSEEFPEGFGEAFYLSYALVPMIRELDTDEAGPDRDALLYIADRVRWGLERAAGQMGRISDILTNPARIERDAWDAERRAKGVA